MSLLSPSLEAFWAVVRQGTVQDASTILGITQTGVTQRIRSLEKQLKTTLFTRSRKGMMLTHEGHALLHYVKCAFETENIALSKIQNSAQKNILEMKIAGPSSYLRSIAIPQLCTIQSRFPLIRFHFDFSDFENNADKLKSGLCDLAILEPQQVTREMESKNLKAERYKIFVSSRWKNKKYIDVIQNETIVDFSLNKSITHQLLQKYKLKNKMSSELHLVNNIDAVACMVAEGLGYAALNEKFVTQFTQKNKLIELTPNWFFDQKLCLAWLPRSEMAPYFKAITEALC